MILGMANHRHQIGHHRLDTAAVAEIIRDRPAQGVLMIDDHLRGAVDPVHTDVIADRQFGMKGVALRLKQLHDLVFADFASCGFQGFHNRSPESAALPRHINISIDHLNRFSGNLSRGNRLSGQ